jgi:hypothetical protein
MRKTLWLIALIFAAIAAPTVLRADDIVYSVNHAEGSFGVTGTVTTDGTIGTLSSTDIIGWDLTLNSSPALTLDPGSSTVVLVGGALSASATQLVFNFTSGFNDNLQFNDSTSSSWWHVVSQPPNLGYNEIAELTGLGGAQYSYISGTQAIADQGVPTRTPEPDTSSLMLIGIGLLGLMMLRRKRISLGHQQAS